MMRSATSETVVETTLTVMQCSIWLLIFRNQILPRLLRIALRWLAKEWKWNKANLLLMPDAVLEAMLGARDDRRLWWLKRYLNNEIEWLPTDEELAYCGRHGHFPNRR